MKVSHEDRMKMVEELASTLIPEGPRPDEFTTRDFQEEVKSNGREISTSWARQVLVDQVEAGNLEMRKIGGKNYYRKPDA
jgi:hypothetical protein